MEDYHAAYIQRHDDTEALRKSTRKIAVMHFGGITIECLLKSIIFATLPKAASQEWKTESNNPGHTITNPGHSYTEALKRCNKLYSRVQKFPEVMKWVTEVENPSQHFIDMRYSCSEPDDASYKHWLETYHRLREWLQKQATQL
ncbi:MAG: hypothetical protein PUP91_22030 [Rhizonema sp. PD37]|nr:hypothetical protein [Rhizonema sp. PD37]